jgi:pimeloyl-ACP methyl ester carboxylesterase
MYNLISAKRGLTVAVISSLLMLGSPVSAPLRAAANAGFQTFRQHVCQTGQRLHGKTQRVQQRVITADMPRQGILAALANPCLSVEFAQNAHVAGREFEAQKSARCVDSYFEVVAFSWHFLKLPDSHQRPEYARAWQLYHSGLARLIATGQQYGRLHPNRGLQVNTAVGTQTIDMTYQGFVWESSDFNRLLVMTESEPKKLNNRYRCPGLGVPLVAQRLRTESERFMQKEVNFPATVVLRPSLAALAGTAPPAGAPSSHHPFELYDPLRINMVAMNGRPVPLASDLSGSFEQGLKDIEVDPLKGLIQPGATGNEAKLFMIEPYQPGKFPVVFVHGLLSSPKIWANLANEIRACPDLRERYQLWAFQYPTGRPFVDSAATLREELSAAVAGMDPDNRDMAMANMVLVGHSMGGLVAKLQVTKSADTMWYAVANRPLEDICATEKQRRDLFRLFYFEPLPFVSRVVFIGTPHDGSSLAQSSVGRCGARLVEPTTAQQLEYQKLLDRNPGVFSPEVQRRIPTSVDMLRPDSELLKAMQYLCTGPHVQLHNIIGTGGLPFCLGVGDGTVPVSSAEHPHVSTQRYVDTTHRKLHDHYDTTIEMQCILRRHISEVIDSCNQQPEPDLAQEFDGGFDPSEILNEEGIVDFQILGESDDVLHTSTPEEATDVQVFDLGPELFPATGE